MSAAAPTLRHQVRRGDEEAVRRIVSGSGFFRPAEVEIAVELVAEALERAEASGYCFVVAEEGGTVVGYTCFGEIPGTEGSWDLYWIAVDSERRGQGLGRRLLAASEERIAAAGGRRVFIETSSLDLYRPTRQFYLRCGYRVEAELADFYRPGDGKVIFGRRL
ncbi:MAG TPA: GNAT family N-acetyltransferase [Thermoanaerobaculia bacterium]|nr:GNAT family N-acetyltransferase [Thermoanaerobaculia bacterium]